MIKPNGADLTQITTDSADDLDAAWSPDGTMIVFSSNREGIVGVKKNFDLWILDLEGTGTIQVTFNPADDGGPFWSKDQYVYFHSNRKDSYDIYRGKPIITW
jgi:TolB protein